MTQIDKAFSLGGLKLDHFGGGIHNMLGAFGGAKKASGMGRHMGPYADEGVKAGRTPALPKAPQHQGSPGFLRPNAKPNSLARHQEQTAGRINQFSIDPIRQVEPMIEEATRRGKKPGDFPDMMPRGPHASPKVRAQLSGDGVNETLSRIGRATRHQDKEFASRVHPLSGRVEAMTRGSHVAAHLPNPEASAARRKMGELAINAKSRKVRDRATGDLVGNNPHLAGPSRLFVHNHPTTHLSREMPSAQDTGFTHQMNELANKPIKGAVLTPREAERGGNKTHVTYFGPTPEKVRLPRRMAPKGKRLVSADGFSRDNKQDTFAHHDMATQPKSLKQVIGSPDRGQTVSRRSAQSMWSAMRDDAERRRGKKKSAEPWDHYVRRQTQKPKKAVGSGIQTRETMVKRNTMSAFGVEHSEVSKLQDPIKWVGSRAAQRLNDYGMKQLYNGHLRTIDNLDATLKGKKVPKREVDGANRQARIGNAIAATGEKAIIHPRTTGALVSSPVITLGGGTAYALGTKKRKKKS